MIRGQHFIGIDVGGTKILGGLVTASGEILAQHKLATPGKAGVREITALITKTVKTLLLAADMQPKDICGIGVAIPGIVDNTGRVVATPNLRLGQVDLRKILQKKLRLPVSIGNDVNLGVLGERWLGAGRKYSHIVGIFPGTGVGGGVIVNNEFISGAQGAAAELGHMQIDPAGPVCTCGNTGCLEASAGRWAIERDIRAAVKKGEKSLISQVAGKDLQRIKSSALSKALRSKDPLVTRVMDQAATALGRACVSLNHIFNPQLFLFGGGVVEACGDFLLPRVEKILLSDPFFRHLARPRVAVSKLGDEAVLLGAVAMAIRHSGTVELSALRYPHVRLNPKGLPIVKGQMIERTCYVRADGKLKEPEEALPEIIDDKDLAEICRKGPETLFIATHPRQRRAVASKGLRLLKKKGISLRLMPLPEAVRTYNNSTDRRAILFSL